MDNIANLGYIITGYSDDGCIMTCRGGQTYGIWHLNELCSYVLMVQWWSQTMPKVNSFTVICKKAHAHYSCVHKILNLTVYILEEFLCKLLNFGCFIIRLVITGSKQLRSSHTLVRQRACLKSCDNEPENYGKVWVQCRSLFSAVQQQ